MNSNSQPQLALTGGLCHLSGPPQVEEHPAAYGMGRIVQLGPGQAGVFLNVRAGGVNVIDFEMGVDVIVFDALDKLDASRAVTLKRNEKMAHPRTGAPLVLVKYPGNIGFVPLGCRRADGTVHPHAGTGFSLGTNIAFPADLSVRRHQEVPDPYSCMELQQYRFDGRSVEVVDSRQLKAGEIFPGWEGWGAGMSSSVADGDDLLMPFYGAPDADNDAPAAPFVSRWQMRDGAWQPVAVVPVDDAAGCREPSLIRDSDGSFLLCARHGWPPAAAPSARLRVWRSVDGQQWLRCLDLEGVRSGGPLCIAQTADGQPFIMGNGLNEGRHERSSVSIWPLNAERNGITQNTVVFDADERCGPAPVYAWNADHSIARVVELADGVRHCLVAIRVCETTEVVKDTLPTPATGCYIEEVCRA